MRKVILFTTISLLLLGLLFCGKQKIDSNKLKVTVIPKATSHIFWQLVHAGAIKAAKELDIAMTWIGPEKEDDRQQQIALVDNQVMNQASGIVLAPLDGLALRRPVQSAVQKNIPVVIIDSDLKDSEDLYTSFIATDNIEGGRIAARKLAELLNYKGKVILLRYMEGSASTENREQGFLEVIRGYDGIEVVSDEQYAGATAAQAQQASENLLFRFIDSAGKLSADGIFCPNESATYGMLQALRRQRLAGTVIFIGFDSSQPLIEGLRQNEIHGLVIQNPFKMGYLGVKTLVAHLNGQPVEKRIDTGVVLVTPSDLEKKEIQELINPELDKWLSQE
jgi:ribose transport system substrate-binding protein